MKRLLPITAVWLVPCLAGAQLLALDDAALSEVQGAGIGIVLDQVLLDTRNASITLNDITLRDAQGVSRNMPIKATELYLGAAGSGNGANLAPVTLGRLTHPFSIDLVKGESLATTPVDVSVLALAFPELLASGGSECVRGYAAAGSGCSSRPGERVDMGIRFDFGLAPALTSLLDIDIGELVMDGSYLRLWGAKSTRQLVGEARVNLFAKTVDVTSCNYNATNASACTATLRQASTLRLSDTYANVALGYGKMQPLLFDVSANGQFMLELKSPVVSGDSSALQAQRNAEAADFYANAPRTQLVIGNLRVGGSRDGAGLASGGVNLGRSEISGLSFNYLKVTSRDL